MSTPSIEIAGPRPEYQEQATFIFDSRRASTFIRRLGLLEDLVLHAWEYGYGRSTLPDGTIDPLSLTEREYKIKCIANMLDLEDTHPGGVEVVTALNHIRNFGRVPLSLLRNQCDNRSKKASRAIGVLCAGEDNNGSHAFSLAKLDQLRQTLPRDTAMVLLEVNSIRSLEYFSDQLQDLGPDMQMDILYIIGHGTRKAATLGADATMFAELSSQTVRRYFAPALKRLVHGRTSQVFISCKSGAGQNSIAEQAGDATGLTTFAPYKNIAVRDLGVSDQDGVLVPDVSYYRIVPLHKRAWQALPTKTRVFEGRRR